MVSFKLFSLLAITTGTALAAPVNTANSVEVRQDVNHYMDIVGYWRQRMGLGPLNFDSVLEGNAAKTVQEANGQLIHKLNPGTMGQVLGQGGPDLSSFFNCFVGGWLCEMPQLPGLGDELCGLPGFQIRGDHGGQTGHAEILSDPGKSRIGCAFAAGVWGCDLA